MKKLLTLLVSICLASFLFIAASAGTLPAEGVIVIPETSSAAGTAAAEKLQEYLLKITGNTWEITDDTAEKAPFEITVGNTNRLTLNIPDVSGAYRIQSFDGGIALDGKDAGGLARVIYGFLEAYCGCHWYADSCIVIPENTLPDLPDAIDDTYTPAFEYTDTDWHSPRDTEYSLANGLNGGVYRSIPDEQGGTVNYISGFCHTLTTQFCAADTYFDEHPEYFALHDGVRVPDQLCLTNETVYEIVRDEVMALLAEKHDPTAALQIVSLTQNDNCNYCECDACKALDEANGSQAGTMITFVNRIADDVAEAGYDNIAIDTFAYQYTRHTPSAVVPAENVIVRLCTIECCFSHALNDPTCEENVSLMEDLQGWGEICDRIYIWDYTTNYAYTVGIFPDFGVLQKNMQVFAENGVRGVYEEGNYYVDSCDTEFGELRAYLLSKLMQDPYCDYDAEMNGFLAAWYGEGWENIRTFLDIITANAAQEHIPIYKDMSLTLSLDKETIAQCDTLWDEAIAMADTDETVLARLQRSQLCWRYWKACHSAFSFSAFDGLYDDMKAAGVTMLHEGDSDFTVDGFAACFNPSRWNEHGFASLWETLFNGIAVGLYAVTLVAALLLFIQAVRKKKYLYLVHLPLLLAGLELALWNRRAYLAWKDIDQFVITLVIYAALYAYIYFCLAKAGKKKAAVQIGYALSGAVLVIAPYLALAGIINVWLMHSGGNFLTIAVILTVIQIPLLAAVCKSLTLLKKTDEE